MNIEWQENYSVGIASIDKQHKKIFNLINKLSTTENKDTGKINETMNALADYVRDHLDYEEILLAEYAYPRFEKHQDLHNQYTKAFAELAYKTETDPDLVLDDTLKFLIDWWNNHILVEDRKYSSFLIQKGVQ